MEVIKVTQIEVIMSHNKCKHSVPCCHPSTLNIFKIVLTKSMRLPRANVNHHLDRDTGGWPASTQGRTEGAETKKEKREEEKGSEESNEAKDCNKEDKWSKSTSSEETEMKEPTKPPAKTQASTQPGEDDIKERKKGMMTIMNPPHVLWKRVVKYARKVTVHKKGPLMNIVWNVWPARRL